MITRLVVWRHQRGLIDGDRVHLVNNRKAHTTHKTDMETDRESETERDEGVRDHSDFRPCRRLARKYVTWLCFWPET